MAFLCLQHVTGVFRGVDSSFGVTPGRKRLCLLFGRVEVITDCKALQRAKGRKSTE